MRVGISLAALGGLLLATALIAYYGSAEVGHALLSAGWRGLVAISAVHLGFWAVCGLAWRVLLPAAPPRALAGLTWARWVRDAGSDLLPISSLGGDLMGARSAMIQGLPSALALASTVVDVTVELVAQLGFTLIGLTIIASWPESRQLAISTVIGIAVAAPLLVGFVVAQRIGLLLLLERAAHGLAMRWRWTGLAALGGVHDAIRQLYRDPRRVLASFVLHLLGWVASAAEAWLALALLGAGPGFLAVLAIESLAYALRSAAFVVPAAVGVQEGGYVLIGPLFGIGPETMLALSLLKRARDLLLGIPALVAWQWIEGGRWRRRAQ